MTGADLVKWTNRRNKYHSTESSVVSVFGVILFRKKYAVIA